MRNILSKTALLVLFGVMNRTNEWKTMQISMD